MDIVGAVKSKDEAAVREMLAKDPSLVRATTPEGLGVLQYALYLRASRVVEALLAAGAKPNVWEAAILGDAQRVRRLIAADPSLLQKLAPDGAPPLHYAAHFGKIDAMRALVSQGADVDAMAGGAFGNTALHAAAAGGQTEAAEALLRVGAKVDARDHNGYTPLHVAAASGVAPLVELLLKRGADASIRAPDGKSPLDFAREREHGDVAALLAGPV
jgi:uncharacterized protein